MVKIALSLILLRILKKARGNACIELRRIKIEASLIYVAKLTFLKKDAARKFARKNRISEKPVPEMNTIEQAERKSSLILTMCFSAARKRTMLALKPSRAKGTISEMVILIKDHVP